jgi:hypothetical protein
MVLDDVGTVAQTSELFGNAEILQAMTAQVIDIDNLYESNESEYWRQVNHIGRRQLTENFVTFCRDLQEPISRMREIYAYEIADRILHDRQLCSFIAQTVMDIGFDGETVEGLRTQWGGP